MKNDIVLNLKMILENRAGRKREDGKGKKRFNSRVSRNVDSLKRWP